MKNLEEGSTLPCGYQPHQHLARSLRAVGDTLIWFRTQRARESSDLEDAIGGSGAVEFGSKLDPPRTTTAAQPLLILVQDSFSFKALYRVLAAAASNSSGEARRF